MIAYFLTFYRLASSAVVVIGHFLRYGNAKDYLLVELCFLGTAQVWNWVGEAPLLVPQSVDCNSQGKVFRCRYV